MGFVQIYEWISPQWNCRYGLWILTWLQIANACTFPWSNLWCTKRYILFNTLKYGGVSITAKLVCKHMPTKSVSFHIIKIILSWTVVLYLVIEVFFRVENERHTIYWETKFVRDFKSVKSYCWFNTFGWLFGHNCVRHGIFGYMPFHYCRRQRPCPLWFGSF